MRMKSHSAGTISLDQISATWFRAAGAAIGLMDPMLAQRTSLRGMGDHEDAHRIATEAGALLLEIRADAAAGRLDPSLLKDEGDRRSNELILELLRQAYPDDAVLSEE